LNPPAWIGALLSVAIVSAIPPVVAVTLPRGDSLKRVVRWLVGFATGALLGTAFLHLIPDAFTGSARESAGLLLLAGFFAFFLIERYVWRHRHGAPRDSRTPLPALATINLIGDALHNALDGMAIAAAFIVRPSLGVATTMAVVLHELPQEVGDFGILLHAGLTRNRALFWNVLSALAAFVGAVLVLLVGTRLVSFAAALIPVTAGGFLYIAASDLVPELKGNDAGRHTGTLLIAIGAGVLLSALPLWLGNG
jgi:zinc and cadmium transporter